MDPYLEDPAFWEDFHRRFITGIADSLLEILPGGYDARIDERVRLVESEQGSVGVRLPDVSINRTTDMGYAPAAAERQTVATLEPVSIPMLTFEEHRDVWIEIVHLPERHLVTAIEVFSPSNKTGNEAAAYHAKRISLYARHVNLVEIDLLRAGQRLSFALPLPAGDYYAFVTRGRHRSADVYAWKLRDPLPMIPVPLKSPDPDVQLDLAAIFRGTFERGRYRRQLRYDRPLRPPISSEDEVWAAQIAGAAQ